MAVDEYRRLACAGCSSEVLRVVGQGRPRKFCEGCRPPLYVKKPQREFLPKSPVPQKDRCCRYCGTDITHRTPQAKTCSDACRSSHTEWQRKQMVKAKREVKKRCVCRECATPFEALRLAVYCSPRCAQRWHYHHTERVKPTPSLYDKKCEQCGAGFQHSMRNAMYCCKRCKSLAWEDQHGITARSDRRRAIKAVISVLKQLSHARVSAAKEVELAITRAMREAERERIRALRDRPCAICQKPVGGAQRTYCSGSCAKQSPATKKSKRIRRKADKARRRGVMAETFDPSEIFDRAGWRCQICGKSTPKKLRGTFKPNAPELDHIIPVSKGGPHTRANTQCACRRCNGEKSDKVVIGQQLLFTSYAPELA